MARTDNLIKNAYNDFIDKIKKIIIVPEYKIIFLDISSLHFYLTKKYISEMMVLLWE